MPYTYLSYPAIPFDAKVRAQSVTFSEDRPIGNTIYGERYQYASATAGVSGAISMEWDLGVGFTSTVDHIIAANAAKLKAQGVTSISLDSASDGIGGTYSNVWTDASFNSATLYGPDAQDYIATGLSLTAKRTWKVKLSGGAASTREINKIYFGTAWNPGKDPDYSYKLIQPEGGKVTTEDGGVKCLRLGDGRYQVGMSWEGVTDAQAQIFFDRVASKWQIHKFFLYTVDNHRTLNNLRLLHVRLLSAPTISRRTISVNNAPQGYTSISCEFQEVRG